MSKQGSAGLASVFASFADDRQTVVPTSFGEDGSHLSTSLNGLLKKSEITRSKCVETVSSLIDKRCDDTPFLDQYVSNFVFVLNEMTETPQSSSTFVTKMIHITHVFMKKCSRKNLMHYLPMLAPSLLLLSESHFREPAIKATQIMDAAFDTDAKRLKLYTLIHTELSKKIERISNLVQETTDPEERREYENLLGSVTKVQAKVLKFLRLNNHTDLHTQYMNDVQIIEETWRAPWMFARSHFVPMLIFSSLLVSIEYVLAAKKDAELPSPLIKVASKLPPHEESKVIQCRLELIKSVFAHDPNGIQVETILKRLCLLVSKTDAENLSACNSLLKVLPKSEVMKTRVDIKSYLPRIQHIQNHSDQVLVSLIRCNLLNLAGPAIFDVDLVNGRLPLVCPVMRRTDRVNAIMESILEILTLYQDDIEADIRRWPFLLWVESWLDKPLDEMNLALLPYLSGSKWVSLIDLSMIIKTSPQNQLLADMEFVIDRFLNDCSVQEMILQVARAYKTLHPDMERWKLRATNCQMTLRREIISSQPINVGAAELIDSVVDQGVNVLNELCELTHLGFLPTHCPSNQWWQVVTEIKSTRVQNGPEMLKWIEKLVALNATVDENEAISFFKDHVQYGDLKMILKDVVHPLATLTFPYSPMSPTHRLILLFCVAHGHWDDATANVLHAQRLKNLPEARDRLFLEWIDRADNEELTTSYYHLPEPPFHSWPDQAMFKDVWANRSRWLFEDVPCSREGVPCRLLRFVSCPGTCDDKLNPMVSFGLATSKYFRAQFLDLSNTQIPIEVVKEALGSDRGRLLALIMTFSGLSLCGQGNDGVINDDLSLYLDGLAGNLVSLLNSDGPLSHDRDMVNNLLMEKGVDELGVTIVILLVHRLKLWTVEKPHNYVRLLIGKLNECEDKLVRDRLGIVFSRFVSEWFDKEINKALKNAAADTILLIAESVANMLDPLLAIFETMHLKSIQWAQALEKILMKVNLLVELVNEFKSSLSHQVEPIDLVGFKSLLNWIIKFVTAKSCESVVFNLGWSILEKYPFLTLPIFEIIVDITHTVTDPIDIPASEAAITVIDRALYLTDKQESSSNNGESSPDTAPTMLESALCIFFGHPLSHLFVSSTRPDFDQATHPATAKTQHLIIKACEIDLTAPPPSRTILQPSKPTLSGTMQKIQAFLDRPEQTLQCLLSTPYDQIPAASVLRTELQKLSILLPKRQVCSAPDMMVSPAHTCAVDSIIEQRSLVCADQSRSSFDERFLIELRHLFPNRCREVAETMGNKSAVKALKHLDRIEPARWHLHIAAECEAMRNVTGLNIKFDGQLIIVTLWEESKESTLNARLAVQPALLPFKVPQLTLSEGKGVSVSNLRTWTTSAMRMLRGDTVLGSGQCNLLFAIAQLADCFLNFFSDVKECLICYCILHRQTQQLPKRECQSCGNLFHSDCLQQWYRTSHDTKCPMCRCVF